LWGCDWTRLLIAGLRWYLLTVIDFFSRYLIAFDIVPTVNASHVKALYRQGLKAQGLSLKAKAKPQLRVDRGSANTSWITKEFFELIGSELSFARVRRPTDNALTERFYGTIKQEEIYLVGNYPDERSAREEIGRYIVHYNTQRPHQALWNFTPAYVHQVNNKTALLQELKAMKKAARDRRKAYWLEQRAAQEPLPGGYSSMDRFEIAGPGTNGKGILEGEGAEKLPFHTEGAEPPKSDSLNFLILSH
jgi:hypothetical protein